MKILKVIVFLYMISNSYLYSQREELPPARGRTYDQLTSEAFSSYYKSLLALESKLKQKEKEPGKKDTNEIASYISSQFAVLDLEPALPLWNLDEIQENKLNRGKRTWYQTFPEGGKNILSVLSPKGTGTKQEHSVIVICSYYANNVKSEKGLNDISSISTLLQVAKALSVEDKRSSTYIFAAFDISEGIFSAYKHFVNNTIVPKNTISAVININGLSKIKGNRIYLMRDRDNKYVEKAIKGAFWYNPGLEVHLRDNQNKFTWLDENVIAEEDFITLEFTGTLKKFGRDSKDRDGKKNLEERAMVAHFIFEIIRHLDYNLDN